MSSERIPLLAHRTGFTLIELLIVVAIVSIFGAALDLAVFQLIREKAFLERSMAMQSEAALTLEALTRDLGRTRGTVSVQPLPPIPPRPLDPTLPTRTQIGKAPGSEEPVLAFEAQLGGIPPIPTHIEYHLRDGVLQRLSFSDSTSRTQTLASSVESLSFQREGTLLSVDIRFACCPINRRSEQRIRTEFYLGENQP